MPRPRTVSLLFCAFLALVAAAASGQNWPAFRGDGARGVADGQQLPLTWDLTSGHNIAWRTPIPGMGHSSPIVWGGKIFLTTAVTAAEVPLVLGDRGGIDLAADAHPHSWRLYCLDKTSGEVLWQREAFAGEPRAKRHVKSSQANPTPATDGRTVVALFGSQGLAAFGVDGSPKWQADLGVLDPGLFGDATSQWGHASSPVIWRDRVFVQVDRHRDSFLAAFDLATGKRLWRVERDEKPVWSTPLVHDTPAGSELVVVGGDYDRGYDPATGRERWRFARDYEVKTPTPVRAGDRLILSGGYRGQPLYALAVGARGDLSARDGKPNPALLWKSEPGGPYTSTPVAYGEHLYFVRDTGILTVLSLATGERLYRERLDSTFSASPLASDGRIYLFGEDGVVSVVAAGPKLELLAANDMGEPLMATPAVSDGRLFIRTRSQLVAIAATPAAGRDGKDPEPRGKETKRPRAEPW